MFGTFCAIAWNAPFALLLFLAFLAGIALLVGALVWKGVSGRSVFKTGLILSALSMATLVGMFWFGGAARCRVARVVREQISREYVSEHFACDRDGRALRGVSRGAAEEALAQCDEDRWDTIAELRSDNVVHDVLLCRTSSGLDLWADHFQRTNGLRDWDVCFTACRSGKCSAPAVITRNTE